MSDAPWFKFYPSDWLAGTRGLTALETGIYIGLIAMMYDRAAPLPRDDARLARQVGATTQQFQRALKTLMDEGKIIEADGGLWNDRVAVECESRDKKISHARTAVAARENRKSQQNQGNIGSDDDQSINERSSIPEARSQISEDNLKQHSPTISREAGLRSENQDWDLLETRCRKAAGWESEPHPNLCVIGPIAELLKTGASLEMDVLPVIAAHAPRCRSRSGWAYFVGPIKDALERRVNARAPPSIAGSQAENAANLKALSEKYGWTPGTKSQHLTG